MTITLWHGQNIQQSYHQYVQAVAAVRAKQQRLLKINFHNLSLAQLHDLLNQPDFFAQPLVLQVENILTGVMSKSKKKFCQLIIDSQLPVLWWEGKKISLATLKPLQVAKAIIHEEKTVDLIWSLLAKFNAHTKARDFANLYQQTYQQVLQENKSGADIYLLSMFCYQLQQLLEKKLTPHLFNSFSQSRLSAADTFSTQQLKILYQQLISLDYHYKLGKLRLPLNQQLLLTLLPLLAKTT